MKPILIYVAHPYGGIAANLERARRWYRWLVELWPQYAYTANWIVECELFDDSDPAQRAAGIARDKLVASRCDKIALVGGRISEGMAAEASTFRPTDRIDLTGLGDEPPRFMSPADVAAYLIRGRE